MNRPLTLNELAHYLKVSRLTLMRWIKKGQLPAKKMGGRWVVEERILHKFSIERDPNLFTAESPKKPAPVADIYSSTGIRQATYQDNRPVKLKEVADNLGVCRRSVTNWIKEGKLAAVKMGGHWVVWQNDLEEFVKRRLLFVEDAAFGMLFFSHRVLEQYRNDFKYYVHEAAFHGRVGSKEERALMHQARSVTKRHPHTWTKEAFGRNDFKAMDAIGFAELMFWKIRNKDGGWMIAIDPRAFYFVSKSEQSKWQTFRITKPLL
ncbi:MAG: helix-turn-helix domain-containing protein [Planctomycetes bacterium]|nr:helix-turn-helix domain-containing protein [Planctomycetota bacterium]